MEHLGLKGLTLSFIFAMVGQELESHLYLENLHVVSLSLSLSVLQTQCQALGRALCIGIQAIMAYCQHTCKHVPVQ